MNFLDFISISVGLLTLLSFLILTFRGQRVIPDKFKYRLLTLVIISILSIIVLSRYYEKQLKAEINRFSTIETQLLQEKYDSLLFTKQEKKVLLDSLRKAENELDEILSRIQKQEKIVGIKTELINDIKNIKEKTNYMISEIETYNEVIDNSVYDKCRKGLTYSGETSLFTFQPIPTTNGEYIDFVIKFQDESIIDKIEVMYIEVCKKHNNGNMSHIYGQYYKPQNGINAFRLKNYFTSNDIKASIGFFWKSDFGKCDYPRYEKVSFP